MMKKLYFICLFLLCGLAATAQDFEIVSVERLDNSMQAANNRVTESGKEGRDCALLRIATQNLTPQQRESFDFVPDMGSKIERRVSRDGEIWLWVTPGLRYLAIKSDLLGNRELSVLDYDINIQSLKTYKIIIRGTMMVTPQPPTKQFLMFSVTPKNATLEVNGELWLPDADGDAAKYVDFGTYTYRVRASDYFEEEGTVTVSDPDNIVKTIVALKPNFAQVTLKVDADAEIWVNNQLKGVRTWTGMLGSGIYKIECRMANHEPSVTSLEITPKMDGEVITLPAPK